MFKSLLKLIIPHIRLRDLPQLLRAMIAGAMISGTYGILHDQITYSIGPEYFHNFKYRQFQYTHSPLPDRVIVSLIGFAATWWVGAIVGWILARRVYSHRSGREAASCIIKGFAVVLGTAGIAGLLGYAYGTWRGPDADYSHWHATFDHYRVQDTWNFIRVGYIHNAGYMGALAGLIATYFAIRPNAVSIAGQMRTSIASEPSTFGDQSADDRQ